MQYRNIAICGVSPEMMEYTATDTGDTLIGRLYNLKGVERVDTHTRTSSLGKWHITVRSMHYLTLCAQIDATLKDAFATFPADIKRTGNYEDFPEPRRLHKLIYSQESKSVSSMTTSQENSLYYSSLINGCSNKLPLEKNITQPPRLTIDMISYCDIVKTGKNLTPSTVSLSSSKTSNEVKTTNTTHTPSTVSSLTSDDVQKMIEKNNDKTSKSFKLLLQEELQKQKQQTDDAIQKITERMDNLENKIEELQQTMATVVATAITTKFTELEKRINDTYTTMEEMLKKTLTELKDQNQGSGSPNRKKTKVVLPNKDGDPMEK